MSSSDHQHQDNQHSNTIQNIDVSKLEENQSIALFAKFKDVANYYFWSCRVHKPSSSDSLKNKNINDVLLNCAPAIDIDDEEVEEARKKKLPLPTSVWMKRDLRSDLDDGKTADKNHNSASSSWYQIQPATKHDEKTLFEPLIAGHQHRIWMNPEKRLNVPAKLFSNGFHVGPTAEQMKSESLKHSKEVMSFQMFDNIIGDMHMDIHFGKYQLELEMEKMKNHHHHGHGGHQHQQHQH